MIGARRTGLQIEFHEVHVRAGDGVAEIACHNDQRGARLPAGVRPAFIVPPKVCRTLDKCHHRDDEEREHHHGRQHLDQRKGARGSISSDVLTGGTAFLV